jgi:Holliday junction resolvase RusA-like endonuclease
MKITLLGAPLSTNNIYRSRGSVRFLMAKARALKDSYIVQARQQWRQPPLAVPLKVAITLYFGDKRVRDWDNYHKLSQDALNGVVWADDSQIMEAVVKKDYDKVNPRIVIDIVPLDN